MLYERVAYMCPECDQIHFFNNSENFSTICPECKVEMVCVEKKFVSAEAEAEAEAKRKWLQQTEPTIYCPYCNSLNTQKISTTAKVVNTAIFGLFGTKRHKQWHCHTCGSDF